MQRLEAARAKREFEATLPPISDGARLGQRRAMVERWELREWAAREAEVRSVQEQRLALLEEAIAAREADVEERHAQQLEARSAARDAALMARSVSIGKAHGRTVRRLEAARERAAAVAAPGAGSREVLALRAKRPLQPASGADRALEGYIDGASRGAHV